MLVALVECGAAHAVTLAPGVLQKLGHSTFEVVLGKPTADPLTYEKPLPLELLPYQERTDKYRSIGTAFAIGPNRFVTAAHVLILGGNSQYGPLALRDSAGAVYRVDKVLKYSGREDYAEFSVVDPPAVTPLETRPKPPLDTPVFAVGNALGEGIVVRDGLYTSDTPEELDGKWQWLRFSAAASPGNSGGPLIDRNGKVIGVVLRKSPNENLNFALAIHQVLEGSDTEAVFEARSVYRMPTMKASDSVRLSARSPLPQPLDEFYAAAHQTIMDWVTKNHADFLKNHADTMFPAGNSEQLLSTVHAEPFPKLIAQSDSGAWMLVGDAPRRVQLEANGYLQAAMSDGVLFLRLRTPDGTSPASLLTDSKKFMDLLLKGYPQARQVGTDSVRITSMGSASSESWFTDGYGRKWLLRSWVVPFNDTVVEIAALPTPDGMIMLLTQNPTMIRDGVTSEMRGLCDFVYLSYVGTLAQWRAFLDNPAALPAAFSHVTLQFDYSRGLGIKTPRFELLVPADVLKTGPDSALMLKFTYLRNGSGATWDLGGALLSDGPQNQSAVDVVRRVKPSPSMPEDTTLAWQKMATAAHPWDGVPFGASGRTEVSAMQFRKGNGASAQVGYTVTLNCDGPQSPGKMKSGLSSIQHGFIVIE